MEYNRNLHLVQPDNSEKPLSRMAQVNAHQLLTSQLFNPAMLDGETLLSWLKVQELKKGQAAAGDLGTAGSGPNSQVQNTPSMAVQRKASTGGGSMDRDDEEDDESAVKIRYICLTCKRWFCARAVSGIQVRF